MPGSIGALSADRADLSNCNWVHAVGDSFPHAGVGNCYADPTSHVHCHPDSDHKTHPNCYPDSHARAGDRYAALYTHCHPDSNQDVHPDCHLNSRAHRHPDYNTQPYPYV